jgi:DNA repair protein RadC
MHSKSQIFELPTKFLKCPFTNFLEIYGVGRKRVTAAHFALHILSAALQATIEAGAAMEKIRNMQKYIQKIRKKKKRETTLKPSTTAL